MEYAPRSINPTEVAASLKSFSAVDRVEKLHIWTITSGQVMLCAELIVQSLTAKELEQLSQQLQAHLNQEFGVGESILQLTSRNYTEALHPLFSNNLVSLLSSRHGTTK
jgi:cobalt-zinc-cadmium efflux system protein